MLKRGPKKKTEGVQMKDNEVQYAKGTGTLLQKRNARRQKEKESLSLPRLRRYSATVQYSPTRVSVDWLVNSLAQLPWWLT